MKVDTLVGKNAHRGLLNFEGEVSNREWKDTFLKVFGHILCAYLTNIQPDHQHLSTHGYTMH